MSKNLQHSLHCSHFGMHVIIFPCMCAFVCQCIGLRASFGKLLRNLGFKCEK